MSEPVLLPPVPNPGSPDHAGPGAKGADGTNGMSVTSSKQSNGTVMTYVDPAADFSLVSVEGRVFKVDSYILKAHSTFFHDLLNDGSHSGEPIHIPASSRIFKAWLDLAHLRDRPPSMVCGMREPLLKLCDDLGSRGVSERALFHMHSKIEKDPWAIFALASQKNNAITPALAGTVTLPYLLGLYVAALKAKDKAHATEHGPGASRVGSIESEQGDGLDETCWKAIAEHFVPVVG
ncbi:hypothetical protein DB88DRAFT_521304 [Papiliotrema laurentii]|uniref:BTB domain-containing protein n=1 Tax=Papiliotrema laurentii TaxID=5418 RepID=A0AAD9FU71_PAPLA|nr:hypothetical protein DB88DRAFT_521304 [Papiliotrema laurentii]